MRARLLLALALAVPLLPAASRVTAEQPKYLSLVGGMHAHSAYSDGFPGSTPASYYASAKGFGNDFFAGSEHSDNADVPFTFNEECLSDKIVTCPGGDTGQPANSLRKWDATGEYAAAATKPGFTAIRGFEWTSDRFGHINTYFSENDANAKIDGGYASMQAFWQWFLRRPELGGGADGLATFNHPGNKDLHEADPGRNWDDFAYVPEADDRMVGMEVYNTTSSFGADYVRALDLGWHLGAVGAEDLGHDRTDDWGGPSWPKTVILAERNDPAAIRAALLARRNYAVREATTRLSFEIDGNVMGSRLQRAAGEDLHIKAKINRPGALLELVTSNGHVEATGTDGEMNVHVASIAARKWYFVRAIEGGKPVAFSSPIWVTSGAPAAVGEWLAGDLHVHTCYSHDGYCGPSDDNTGPEEFYTLSANIDQRFTEASAKGLDYLAITDHNDVRSSADPGFGTHGVLGLPAYENSLSGHAQMLGARRLFAHGDGAAAITAMAEQLRDEGGVFQINHPTDDLSEPLDPACTNTAGMGWNYGFNVVPDTIEVWNIGFHLQAPLPAGMSNDDSLRYWECWLQRGYRIGATGGSDSHWVWTAGAQGVGDPTTWVFARERSQAGLLTALREGRTAISLLPPSNGGVRLVLEADADRDGVYESMVGDTVPPGTPMRVRADGPGGQSGGLVRVRANGATLLDAAPMAPGAPVTFNAPAGEGWVRAELYVPDGQSARTTTCEPVLGGETSYCRNQVVMSALTSAIYLAK